jgi:membrane dipeptidase
MMKVIDAHCDALSKLFMNPRLDFYKEEQQLDVSYPRLQKGGVKLQCFAIYISEQIMNPSFEHVLQMVDLFYRRIIHPSGMQAVKSVRDMDTVLNSDRIGAMLTLEGADALMGNMTYLQILYQLGVRIIGITWNYANWAADGVMEPRNGGFTAKGKRMIKEMEQLGMLVDVSHLAIKGFWELLEIYKKPIMASHSNVWEVCPHPRNLSNEQIKAIIESKGQIGITFVPYFVKSGRSTQIQDLVCHIDHICAMGGESHVGFGSDFDGIEKWINGLENARKYEYLIETLCKNYTEDQVEKFMSRNWQQFFRNNLPRE